MLAIRYWEGRSHDLGRMSFDRLVKTFFTYPAIVVYLVLGLACSIYALTSVTAKGLPNSIIAAALAVGVYPFVWYFLHRFILHGRLLYKFSATATLWKRIHFDHHQDPHDLRVLFGALPTTLPTIVSVTVPIGYLLDGWTGAAAATASGLFTTCFYEFCHCVQHLKTAPEWGFLQRIKRLHLAHHFHNEQGNYGITNFAVDRLFGTHYEFPKDIARSPTVYNLGYTQEERQQYPYVLNLSGGVVLDGGPRDIRRQQGAAANGVAPAGDKAEAVG